MSFLRRTVLAAATALLLIPSVAAAAPNVGVRLDVLGAGTVGDSIVAHVGDTVTLTTTVTAGSEPVTGATITVPAATEQRAPKVVADSARATCTRTSTSFTCTVASLAPGEQLRIDVVGQLYRVGNPVLASTTSSAADPFPNDDRSELRLNVLRDERRGCSLLGTPGADRLVGTPGDDVICGLAGNDRIAGGGGRDELFGDAGRDLLLGGPGDDRLVGGAGDDQLRGGAGTDSMVGGAGNDVLLDVTGSGVFDGGPGNDVLTGGAGVDAYFGGAGNDRIRSCDGLTMEIVLAGAGRDTLFADPGDILRDAEVRRGC